MKERIDMGYGNYRISFRNATVAELRERFRDHLDWMLSHDRPDMVALGRARGEWDANNLEAMSAYERVATLWVAGAFAAKAA